MTGAPSVLIAGASPGIETPAALRDQIDGRAKELLRQHQLALWKQTDRLFALLFILQWFAGIMLACWLSPRAWAGLESRVHPHVWAAVFLGGFIASCPVLLAVFAPGQAVTRYVISIAQMMHSALLIHLSGGRIETHFHIFGSLAFLSFYRDWRVLIPATLVTALDHALRGTYWPQSVFGVSTSSHLRWLEHAGWVVFEDIFLVWACVRAARELTVLALRQAELEATNHRVEAEVKRQTERLESVSRELVTTARRAGMAEIATGVLHNVGNVLNSVNVSANIVVEKLKHSEVASLAKVSEMLSAHQENLPAFLTTHERGKHLPPFLIELADCLGKEQVSVLAELQSLSVGLDHIKQVVSSQQQHAKQSLLVEAVSPQDLFEQAIAMDAAVCAGSPTPLVRRFEPIAAIEIDKHMLLQILINLLSNARKSVSASARADGQIIASTRILQVNDQRRIQFEVCDNGVGIAPENLTRIFAHGFTTSSEGHGFGLHSAANAARQMRGDISVNSAGPGSGATFTVDLPLIEPAPSKQSSRSNNTEEISCQH